MAQLGENILACKLLRKCCKDEVLAGVIAVVAQCAEGIFMSWVPYLSNLFQIDHKDMQEEGTEFHYSWLLTLISFMGWKESDYVIFYTTPQQSGERYCILKYVPLDKHKKENIIIFESYL